ncbi:hypothetical protein CLF_113149 [Clonorchis sinensis]|uniref:Pol-related protein n=1 Tax=Clonorchis sinensis TaxID=79923 RepID=G7YXR6_CLOSI|nr:hypothetical protein CLF_113149 [Clonorchis sinensis]
MHGEKGPEDITRIDAKKDLGIWLSPNLSFSLHLEKSAQKAFAVLRMIRRTFSRITRTDFQILYGAYVRPLVEYANPVVFSGRTKDVILIGRVQRAATKMVAGFKSVDYETRLAVLDLFPLECRRLRGDLILTYALFEQGLANRFCTVDPANTRRGHGERQLLNDKDKTDPGILDLGNLAVSQPSCFLWVAWQLGTERVLQLKEDRGVPINIFIVILFSGKPHLGNLAVSQPSCFLWVAWQLGTERVLQLKEDRGVPINIFIVILFSGKPRVRIQCPHKGYKFGRYTFYRQTLPKFLTIEKIKSSFGAKENDQRGTFGGVALFKNLSQGRCIFDKSETQLDSR